MNKNQIWLPVIIVIGLLIGVTFAYVYKSSNKIDFSSLVVKINTGNKNTAPRKDAIAYVSSAVGASTKVSGAITSQVVVGDVLYTGDILRTEAVGNIELIYTDSSIIRIASSSTYELRNADIGRLESGSLWARIIRPFDEAKFFTLESSDISAEVLGTAIILKTDRSGTEVIVVDSSIEKDSVNIRAITASGIIQTTLNPEESISIFELSGVKKVKVNMQRLLTDRSVVYNIKNDILYLLNRKKSWAPAIAPIQLLPINTAEIEKMEKEILASLPKNTELQGFFESKAIELEYSQAKLDINTWTNTKILSPSNENIIRILFWDELSLMQMKYELQLLRTQNLISSDEMKKDGFQKSVNSLQEKIQGFDQNFIKNYSERLE